MTEQRQTSTRIKICGITRLQDAEAVLAAGADSADYFSAIDSFIRSTLGDAAAWPVQSFVKRFRDEFEAHVATGKCVV